MSNREHFLRALRGLKDSVGDEEVERLANLLAQKSEDVDRQWQQAVLKGLADAVRQNGSDALDSAYIEIEKALAGHPANLDFTTLRAASDILAVAQNEEAEKRERIRGFLQAAFKIIRQAVKAVL